MNTIHNNGKNDQLLQEDLEKLDKPYKSLEQDEPPELLDKAILNSAHRALEKTPGWMQSGWLHGLATAAVFVLAFTIILDQRESAPDIKEDILLQSPSAPKIESALRKQPVEILGESDNNIEPREDSRQKSTMTPERRLRTPVGQEVELRALEQHEEPLRRAQSDQAVLQHVSEENKFDDKDLLTPDDLQEEVVQGMVMLDETDAMADAPPIDAVKLQLSPAAASEPVNNVMNAMSRTETSIEQEIQTIIELRESGDSSWVAELETFVARYPDYPLPQELKD